MAEDFIDITTGYITMTNGREIPVAPGENFGSAVWGEEPTAGFPYGTVTLSRPDGTTVVIESMRLSIRGPK